MKWLVRVGTHLMAVGIGFVLGIYLLPILIAPEGPKEQEVQSAVASSEFTAEFRRDLTDSDALHWGEGALYVGSENIVFEGKLAPGPDYRLYLSPQFVETEAEFLQQKDMMVDVGAVRTFDNFMVTVPHDIDPSVFNAAIVWCESFNQFITAAKYQ